MRTRRERLDKLLVERGLVQSRERARQLIMAGAVFVGGQRSDKAGNPVDVDAPVHVRASTLPFVSRGGLKLDAALCHWKVNVTGAVAVDVGASTGGFTDCLLQRGARHVYAIDVGQGQFAWRLRQDPRVTLLERTNVRHFDPSTLPEQADVVVIDVSFISLRLVLPTAQRMLRPSGIIVALVKPQFEVGRRVVGKGGVVRGRKDRQAAVEEVRNFGVQLGLHHEGTFASPVLGPKGNQEFFLRFQRPRRFLADTAGG